ncbi:GNAT family N-acetyltransferase [candidate division KSB1 bacterium]
MEDLEITPMRAGDLQALARILAESDVWKRKRRGYGGAVHFFKTHDPSFGEIHVARLGDKIAGLIWFSVRNTFYEFGYIRLVAVAPDCYGQGIGTKLMAFAEEKIGREVRAVFLLVSDFNTGARRLYERLGYSPCGVLANYKGEANDEIIMCKADWEMPDNFDGVRLSL